MAIHFLNQSAIDIHGCPFAHELFMDWGRAEPGRHGFRASNVSGPHCCWPHAQHQPVSIMETCGVGLPGGSVGITKRCQNNVNMVPEWAQSDTGMMI